MKKKLLVVLSTAMLTLGLVACGSKPSTVEEFYSRDLYKAALDQQIESMEESYSDQYSDIGYSLSGNTFTYTYTFAEQIEDTDAVAEKLAQSLTAESLADGISGMEEETGIDGISVQYIYYNADGSEIFNETFTN